MKQRLTSESKEEAEELSAQLGQEAGDLEFESVEALIRHDAALTTVPPQLLDRVLRDIDQEPPTLPWWKRWFRK